MRRGRAKVPLSLARAALALPGSQPSRMPLRHARENGAFERLWLFTSGREARADQALSCLHVAEGPIHGSALFRLRPLWLLWGVSLRLLKSAHGRGTFLS